MIIGIELPERFYKSFKLGVPDLYEDDNVYIEIDEIGLRMIEKNQLNEEEEE